MGYLGRWVTGWATASNARAVANARAASTLCSRRRLQHEEVAMFLASLELRASGGGVTAATTGVHAETSGPSRSAGVDSLSG